MEGLDGRPLFRNWATYSRSQNMEATVKYPMSWEQYFVRPAYYPRTPLGKFFFSLGHFQV